jgi:hypothetical protein
MNKKERRHRGRKNQFGYFLKNINKLFTVSSQNLTLADVPKQSCVREKIKEESELEHTIFIDASAPGAIRF